MLRKKSSSGAVLIIVLWVLSMLTALGLGMSYRAGLEAKRIGLMNGKTQSIALCQAAIYRMMFELDKNENGYDALSEEWSNSKNLFDHFRMDTGNYTISYEQRATEQSKPKTITLYGAMAEESLLNVNTATKEIWERLLKELNIAPDLHEAILDWVDGDSNARFHGAESYDYASMDKPYRPHNGNIPMLEELLLVKGMKPDIFQKLAPTCTVYGDGKVNINTAGEQVLLALGLPEDLIEKILRYRKGLDGEDGTSDDGVFRDIARVPTDLETTEGINNTDRFMLNNLTPLLTVSSRFFRIRAQGESTAGVTSRVTAVVERFPKSMGIATRLVAWKEE